MSKLEKDTLKLSPEKLRLMRALHVVPPKIRFMGQVCYRRSKGLAAVSYKGVKSGGFAYQFEDFYKGIEEGHIEVL